MWIPFYNKQNSSTDSQSEHKIEDELPADIKSYLGDHEPLITEREFQKALHTSANISKLASAPSLKDVIEKPNPEELLNNMNAFNKPGVQEIEKLSPQQLKERTELEEYRRKNPTFDAVLENCSELQKNFFDCLTNGSIKERLTGCNEKQNFHQFCLSKQLLIFRMFDYDSMDKITQLDEIRGTADVVFNKYYHIYDDIDDEKKNKQYGKELQVRRDNYYQKYGK